MKAFIIGAIMMVAISFAQGFNGTFQNQQGTGQIVLQQAPDGTLQGQFTGANGAMDIQGNINPQGAYGILSNQEIQLAFAAQLSPDGLTLQMLIAPFGQDGQPDTKAAQQLIYQRVNANQSKTENPLSQSENPLSPSTQSPLGQGFLESFDSPDTEFASYLLLGPDNGWHGQLSNGSYQLSNTGDPGTVKYFYATALGGNHGPLSNYPVSIEVLGQFPNADYSQAGLLFSFDPQNRFYYAFLIKGGNMVAVVLRDAEGFRELVSGSSDALQIGQINRLSITPENGMLRMLVNGQEVMRIESPSLAPGGVGIIATGNGNFSFDNFRVGF